MRFIWCTEGHNDRGDTKDECWVNCCLLGNHEWKYHLSHCDPNKQFERSHPLPKNNSKHYMLTNIMYVGM